MRVAELGLRYSMQLDVPAQENFEVRCDYLKSFLWDAGNVLLNKINPREVRSRESLVGMKVRKRGNAAIYDAD